jgi:hypothetical protein
MGILYAIYGKISMTKNLIVGTSKNRLLSEVPLRFLALRAAKRAFLSGSSLKTEVFRDALVIDYHSCGKF